ncbi:UNVERIFIED_CONTAM: hypothetical protein FKN15_061752 [Acipenser sinensis]
MDHYALSVLLEALDSRRETEERRREDRRETEERRREEHNTALIERVVLGCDVVVLDKVDMLEGQEGTGHFGIDPLDDPDLCEIEVLHIIW